MLALVALVVSIGIADAVNPSTLGPALVYGLSRHPRKEVAEFTLGVFAVSTAGGLALLFGPGRLLVTLVSRPSPHTVHVLELATGAGVLALAGGLWLARAKVIRRLGKRHPRTARSAFLLGAGIMAVELPTAFPYFAAIAAIVGSRFGTVTQVALALLYNLVFVAPLVALLGLVAVAGRRGARVAAVARESLQRHAPVLLPAALALVGIVLLGLGGIGLART
jgi:cytochrome c biogenesis protein CcdA